jgi:hypothetical protein
VGLELRGGWWEPELGVHDDRPKLEVGRRRQREGPRLPRRGFDDLLGTRPTVADRVEAEFAKPVGTDLVGPVTGLTDPAW